MACVHTLKVGRGIAKLAGNEPFQIKIPLIGTRKDITDEEVIEHLKQTMAEYHMAPRMIVEKFEEYLGKAKGDIVEVKEISEFATRLLEDTSKHPFSALKERYDRIGLSACKGTKAKNELVANGHVKEVEIKSGDKGGRAKLLEPTDKGNGHLLLNGTEPAKPNGKGGLKHQYWQERIRKYFAKWGCKAQVELYIGRKSVDVVVVCPNKKTIAVEIAMNPYYEVENVKKDLTFGFDEIIVACNDERVQKIVEKNCKKYFEGKIPARIRFCQLKQFNGSSNGNGFESTVSGHRNKETSKIRNGCSEAHDG